MTDDSLPPQARNAVRSMDCAAAAPPLPESRQYETAHGAEHAMFKLIGSIRRFERNETIFLAGDEARFLYRVIGGAVRLVKVTTGGRRYIAGFQMEGDVFGIEWSSLYALTAEAVTDTVAVCISRSRLEGAGSEHVDLRGHAMKRLLQDLRAAQDRLFSLSCQSARERVASFLLFLFTRSDAEDGDTIALAMGREDIADYLGVAVETICRILLDLKTSGAIEIPSRNEIVVRSSARLRGIVGAST